MRRDGHSDLASQKELWEQRVFGGDKEREPQWSTTPVQVNFHSDARGARKEPLMPTLYPDMTAFASSTALPESCFYSGGRECRSLSLCLTNEADAFHRRMNKKKKQQSRDKAASRISPVGSTESARVSLSSSSSVASSSLWLGFRGFSLGRGASRTRGNTGTATAGGSVQQQKGPRASSLTRPPTSSTGLSPTKERDMEDALQKAQAILTKRKQLRSLPQSSSLSSSSSSSLLPPPLTRGGRNKRISRSLDRGLAVPPIARATTLQLTALNEAGSYHSLPPTSPRLPGSLTANKNGDDSVEDGWSVASSYPSTLLAETLLSGRTSSHAYDGSLALVPASSSLRSVSLERGVFSTSRLNDAVQFQGSLRPSDEDRSRTVAEYRRRGAHKNQLTVPRAPAFSTEERARPDDDRHGFRSTELALARAADIAAVEGGQSHLHFDWGRKRGGARLTHESRLYSQRKLRAKRDVANVKISGGEGQESRNSGGAISLTTKPSAFRFFYTSQRARIRETQRLLRLGSSTYSTDLVQIAGSDSDDLATAEYVTQAEQVNGYYKDYGRKKGSEALSLAAEEYAVRDKQTKPRAFTFFHTTQRALARRRGEPDVEVEVSPEQRALEFQDIGRKRASEALKKEKVEFLERQKAEEEARRARRHLKKQPLLRRSHSNQKGLSTSPSAAEVEPSTQATPPSSKSTRLSSSSSFSSLLSSPPRTPVKPTIEPRELMFDLDMANEPPKHGSPVGVADAPSSVTKQRTYARATSASSSRIAQRQKEAQERRDEIRRANERTAQRLQTPPNRARAAQPRISTSVPIPRRPTTLGVAI